MVARPCLYEKQTKRARDFEFRHGREAMPVRSVALSPTSNLPPAGEASSAFLCFFLFSEEKKEERLVSEDGFGLKLCSQVNAAFAVRSIP
jgi:hypothetical protein